MQDSDPIIRIKGLSKAYGKGETRFFALSDFNLEINKGEFLSVVGRSGSGKSTLLNLLGGLDTPTEGEIQINGKPLLIKKRSELVNHRRFFTGIIFQSFNLIHRLSAIDNIVLALAFGRVPILKRKEIARQLLIKVGLEKRMHHKPAELSGGECQRVAIARALANNPKVLLADEPTGNLDSITSGEIMEIIADLNKNEGLTVLMITHEEALAKKHAHKIIRLHDGKIFSEEILKTI